MSAVLGTNVEALNFSDYSVNQINSYVNTYGSCLAESANTQGTEQSAIELAAKLDKSGLFVINVLNLVPNCSLKIEAKNSILKSHFQSLYSEDRSKNSSTLISFLSMKFKGKIALRAEQTCSNTIKRSNKISLLGYGGKKLTNKRFKKILESFRKNLI